MKKKDVKITIIDSLGPKGCHRGHRVGDTFSYDKDRGRICPMAMHVEIRRGHTGSTGRNGRVLLSRCGRYPRV